MVKTVSILGCGWLGFPLARTLSLLGYEVKGSTTTSQKLSVLKSSNIIPFQLTCTAETIEGDHVADFFDTDVLFVNIPFKRDLPDPHAYVGQMQVVLDHALRGQTRRILFASSTSIYPMLNQTAREDDVIIPMDERAKALLDAERVFLGQKQLAVTIVRFAGLYGPDREIASFLRTGRVPSREGNAPVNLIHLDDCIGIITTVLKKDLPGEIINACGDAHPMRKDLYIHAAIAMGIKPPQLGESANPPYKIISNEKVKHVLGYRFIHPGPWNWIDQRSINKRSA